MNYALKPFMSSDMPYVVNQVVPGHMVDKYLNKSFKYRVGSILGVIFSELYILRDINNSVVAAGVIRTKRTPFRTNWFYGIEVRTDLRGKGIGTALIRELMNVAKEKNMNPIFIKVKNDNNVAIVLYKKFGFNTVKTRGSITVMKCDWKQ